MTKIAIVTDSSSNLPKAFIESNHVRVIPLKIHWDGNAFEDGVAVNSANNGILFINVWKNRRPSQQHPNHQRVIF